MRTPLGECIIRLQRELYVPKEVFLTSYGSLTEIPFFSLGRKSISVLIVWEKIAQQLKLDLGASSLYVACVYFFFFNALSSPEFRKPIQLTAVSDNGYFYLGINSNLRIPFPRHLKIWRSPQNVNPKQNAVSYRRRAEDEELWGEVFLSQKAIC